MKADFFTKPLQGKQFEMFQNVIMNATVAKTAPLAQAHEVPCVGQTRDWIKL
jgi:hypothetical protein